MLAWARRRGTSAVFKSSSAARIAENAQVAAATAAADAADADADADDGAGGGGSLAASLDAISNLPQQRRYPGAGFVGEGRAFRTLGELWDEPQPPSNVLCGGE